jgi:3-oxoacyl-[acyl-carrier protein] reductase
MAARAAHAAQRVAIVTGASRGIGASVAQQLAAAGFSVAAISRTDASARHAVSKLPVVATSQSHMHVGVDVSDSAALEAALQNILTRHGAAVDVLVNAAGECAGHAKPDTRGDRCTAMMAVSCMVLLRAAWE